MKLIHGDCLEKMKDIPDNSVDMILADLPYGTTACSWDIVIPFEPLWVQYKRVIKKKGAIVLFGSEPFSSLLRVSNLDWYKYDWVWEKTTSSNFLQANFQPIKKHEIISVFSNSPASYNPNGFMLYNPIFTGNQSAYNKGQGTDTSLAAWKYRRGDDYTLKSNSNPGKFPVSILKFDSSASKLHPTEKPVALLEYLIKTYTQEGDLVLDNCMGSGSTGIACLNTKRDFIGIELYPLPNQPVSKKNPDYFGIAKNRIAKWQFEPSENSKEEQINLF